MDGILTSEDDLKELSQFLGTEYLDECIPLPNVSMSDQAERMRSCGCSDDDTGYWESDTGSHGWCCYRCGVVSQWG